MDRIWCYLLMIGILLQVSCARSKRSESPPKELTLEQRVEDLENHMNSNRPAIDPEAFRKQYEADLAEIGRLGLVQRAEDDIRSHLGNVTVKSWTIGYFVNTNTVWCDVRYSMPPQEEVLQKEFGYARTGTNWTLMWDAGLKP
jgi:hypothetical protein